MKTTYIFTRRNVKIFFRDKALFFTSLVTPLVLLLLYVTFLGNVFHDSFLMVLPEGFEIEESLIGGFVGAQLVSSLMAVSCVTVAFCSNMMMVMDKANGTIRDLTVSPVRPSVMAVGYYTASLLSSLLICFSAGGICLAYLAHAGWYMSGKDVVLLFTDVLILSMFGVALSSVVNFFLTSQGQISAVGTIVGAGYGFVCGAYMPVSQFSEGLQTFISYLPGTYGTSLLRNHAMRGVFEEMSDTGFPDEVIEGIRDSVDCNLYFRDSQVDMSTMYMILAGTVLLLIAVYVLLNVIKGKRRSRG